MFRFTRAPIRRSAPKLPLDPNVSDCPCGGDCPCGDKCPGGDDCPCTRRR
jgi:hypothetical protein